MGSAETIEERLSLAFELFESDQLAEAEAIYDECLTILDENSEKYIGALHWLGYVKSGLEKFSEARLIYRKLKEKAKSKLNVQDELIAIHQLGMVERMAENYDEAQKLFDDELNLLKEKKPDFHVGFAANYYERGYILLKKGMLAEAEDLMVQSLHYSEQSNDLIALGCSLRGLGEIFSAKGDLEMAKGYFEQSIQAFKKGDSSVAVREVINLIDKI